MIVHSGKHQWMEMLAGSFILKDVGSSGGIIPMKDGRWYVFYGPYKHIVESAAEGMGWVDSITTDISILYDKINGPRFVSVTTWTAERTPAAPDADTKEHPMAKSKSVKGKAAKPSPAKSKAPAKKSGRGR